MTQPPARTPQNGNDLHSAVGDFFDKISNRFYDHDALIAEAIALRNRAEVAEGMVDHLKEQLRDVTAERDHYMRLSMSQSTRLSAAMGILSGIQVESAHEANNPGPKVVEPEKTE